jgi:hypothetical protein
MQSLDTVRASADVAATKAWQIGLDYSYFRPFFDADSIFNVFGLEPMDDWTLRVSFDPNRRVSVTADATLRARPGLWIRSAEFSKQCCKFSLCHLSCHPRTDLINFTGQVIELFGERGGHFTKCRIELHAI